MPRPLREIHTNYFYHVRNRANRRAQVFHDATDYGAFIALMAKAQEFNQPQTAAELEAVRECVNKQQPFGEPVWIDELSRTG